MISYFSCSKELHFRHINKHSSKYFNIFLMPIQTSFFQSPIGILEIKASEKFIQAILFVSTIKRPSTNEFIDKKDNKNHPIVAECDRQMNEYFKGARTVFDFPCHRKGLLFNNRFGMNYSISRLAKQLVIWNCQSELKTLKPSEQLVQPMEAMPLA
jgi:hypothetical protein